MPTLSERLERHSDKLQRQVDIATNLHTKRFLVALDSLSDQMAAVFAELEDGFLTTANRQQVAQITAQLNQLQGEALTQAQSQYVADARLLFEFAGLDTAEFLGHFTQAANAPNFGVVLPAVIYATGDNLTEHFKRQSDYEQRSLANLVKAAWAQNLPITDLIKQIIGTRSKRYRDGYLRKLKVRSVAVVDTANQHVYQVAKSETFKASGIERYQIVATLDLRTTEICRDLDSNTYEVGAVGSPYPPFHYRCRTTIVPVLDDDMIWLSQGRMRASIDGYVPDMSYRAWEEMRLAA